MKSVGSNKRKGCEINRETEEVSDDRSIEGRRKRQCRNEFIRYFGKVVRQIKAKDGMAGITKGIRREIRSMYKNLPSEEKCQYKSECERVVKSNMAKAKFFTRCAPNRFSATVSQLTNEQRVAVCEMGFNSLIQLNCGRLKRKLYGWLVERIDTARCILELNGTEVELSPKSFSYIMGHCFVGHAIMLWMYDNYVFGTLVVYFLCRNCNLDFWIHLRTYAVAAFSHYYSCVCILIIPACPLFLFHLLLCHHAHYQIKQDFLATHLV